MDAAVAETVVRSTRERAVADARNDLKELRRRAVEAGRERSLAITKTSLVDRRSGAVRYNPAGRVTRDWYVHVYLNTLRMYLGEPAVPIDAQQVEDTAALLGRLRPDAPRLQALQAVGVVRNVAIDDAAHAAAEIVNSLHEIGARRAIRHVADDRFDDDELRVHLTRHWYLRAYEDHVDGATRSRPPLAEVTAIEERLVAGILVTRVPVQLIGMDGLPTFTRHGTPMADVDRRLAEGETGVASVSDMPRSECTEELSLQAFFFRTEAPETARDVFAHRTVLQPSTTSDTRHNLAMSVDRIADSATTVERPGGLQL